MHKLSKALLGVAVLTISLASIHTTQAGDAVITRNVPANANHSIFNSTFNSIFNNITTGFVKPEARNDEQVIAPSNKGFGTPTIPPHGGINPVGDVTCEMGEEILANDGYNVFLSDCVWYIYDFRATQGASIVEISMSSFSGEYTTKLIGIVN
jgi:hypothetical protein